MTKKHKFKLIKTAAVVTTIGLAVAFNTFEEDTTNYDFDYSAEELIENEYYTETLNQIKNEEPFFNNTELYNYICRKLKQDCLYESDLSSIKKLTIDEELTNTDLSDLKYLYNLKELIIKNNEVDLNDLYFNNNLIMLTFEDSKIKNTNLLPNSINILTVVNTEIEDNNFTIPFLTRNLLIVNSSFNNLTLKAPENLNYLYIHGDSFLDLESISTCENLRFLSLKRISNIKNPEVLLTLNLDDFYVDDYAPIWMNTYILENLPYRLKDKEKYLEESIALDTISNEIINENDDDNTKIKKIIIYIIDNLEYDYVVANKLEDSDLYSSVYNEYPIEFALSGRGVCINYAALFQGLANRNGIDSCQLYSEIHGWNAINIDGELHYIDPTFLDNSCITLDVTTNCLYKTNLPTKEALLNGYENGLYYYDFNAITENNLGIETHIANNLPKESITTNKIGYVDAKKDSYYIFVKLGDKLYRCIRIEFYMKYIIGLLFADVIRRSKIMIEENKKTKKEKIHNKALKLRKITY